MIELAHVTFRYPEAPQPALRDVTLSIPSGDFVLVAGPSGAGKSTFLRLLNGLVPHFSGGVMSGQVRVNGLDVIAAGPAQLSRQVGFVFQNPEAQSVLSEVEAEIAFALENAALPPAEMRLRVEEVLSLLDLSHLRARQLETLSGGERQRVAIAAAMALRPQVLVLDEPTSQLDPKSAADVLAALVRLNEDLGLTVILAEHRQERIARYADQLIYLEAGRLIAAGPIETTLLQVPQASPLATLGRALGWETVPLTTKAARRRLPAVSRQAPERAQTTVAPTAAASSLLQVTGLQAGYGDRPVLSGVDLSVRPGEIVALLGRNGAGKSTLLRCLVGLQAAWAGEICVNGAAIRGRAVADISRQVAYLPQNPDDLLFADSVTEELAATLRNHGQPAGAAAVLPLLQDLGLAEVGSAYPRDLSVGQRQRVALGAVTITRPPLVLLDEPTRGLDYAAKASLADLWRRWATAGAGLLLVTHDVELVAGLADRVLVLADGRIIANGTPAAVMAGSPLFAPQINRLFPNQSWLTVAEALAGLDAAGAKGAAYAPLN